MIKDIIEEYCPISRMEHIDAVLKYHGRLKMRNERITDEMEYLYILAKTAKDYSNAWDQFIRREDELKKENRIYLDEIEELRSRIQELEDEQL